MGFPGPQRLALAGFGDRWLARATVEGAVALLPGRARPVRLLLPAVCSRSPGFKVSLYCAGRHRQAGQGANWQLGTRWGIFCPCRDGFSRAGSRWYALSGRKLSDLFRRRKATEEAPPRAGVPDDVFVAAIGDVHGHLDLVETLWQLIRDRARQSQCRHKVLIFVGDYVDRGHPSLLSMMVLVTSANLNQQFPTGLQY